MNKVNLSWIPQVFENFRNQQLGLKEDISLNYEEHAYLDGKIDACSELLENIKQFIKDANTLQEK